MSALTGVPRLAGECVRVQGGSTDVFDDSLVTDIECLLHELLFKRQCSKEFGSP